MHSPSFLPAVPRSDASLPSTRSGWSRIHASPVLSRRYDFLPSFPPRSVAFAWRYLLGATWFRSHRPRRNDGGPGVFGSASPKAERCQWRRQDLPSSWETPIVSVPCSSTPVGLRDPLPSRSCTAWPPLREGRGLRQLSLLSKLNRTALKLAVYASWGESPHTTQDSLPGAG